MGGLWPWVLALLSWPCLILGAPSASSFPEGLTPEENNVSWDKDIPAINQGIIPEKNPESSFLIEGDIIRPSPVRLLSATSNKWPKNSGGIVEIPFLLSSNYDEPSRKVILEAFAEFERYTCVRFVSHQGQRDFISIIPMYGCFSSVGRSGGMQMVSLAPACLRKGRGIVLHELMHVLGFWHEHARADRDSYIRVNWNEILPGFEINFIKSRSSNMLTPYDYSSVMHYGRLAFSRRGLPTIIPLWASSVHVGQRWNLSASDITRVLKLYGCSPSGPGPQGTVSQAHSSRRNPTPVSRPSLQQLLEVLSGEPRSLDPSNPRPEGQDISEGPGENSHGWESPALQKFIMEASARLPQTLASSSGSRPKVNAPAIALAQQWLAQVPTEPPASSSEPGGQPVPIQVPLGNPALPGGCVPGSHFGGMPRD
ncbi:astacin-like metalloendopeptidase [Nycticebus coucang]|uniref:astacin-like metalloendopeptidase n=1 Tax=Nycticebus coucang TaxID=9470 RepID=UPI00234C25D1|nr:astacin-like metalloendopeptidase [Nycticebus coucang]